MFKDLFNESEPIGRRLERFIYHCDRLREKVNAYGRSMKNHFYSDKRIVSLYLAFSYPDKYAIYKFKEIKRLMEIVIATDISGRGELKRFF